ncbi:uncharacterized protein LOC123672636 isoform X2 [Harmonia axyridis]|nr:uncharacterized protein LOC123672636 isoform X2 [Harmonia axyridis]
MSVEDFGFPLPVKIEEEDQKLCIDLDTEENSPEDIVIEWHLEIRRFFSSYSAASGEIKLVTIMKEYITSLTERAIHFEHVVRLHEMVDYHMEHIYWFYRDSDTCLSDLYLDYMEHIMTFYVNLSLRVLLALKSKIKVTQEMVNNTTQKVIKRLSFYLLKSEYHIFHVLIRQTTTMVDGMIKDLMSILNSNICKQIFRNIYKFFLVMVPIRDLSEEAFCRAFILFENWKAFENHKHNEHIEKCMENIFNHTMDSIKENEFLRDILMPKTSIISELMRVMGCDPSITKAYFDYIKAKQKQDGESIDDIGKLKLENVMLSDTEDTESVDEDDGVDFDDKYEELFGNIMKNSDYDLDEVLFDCKNERNSLEVTSGEQDPDIMVVDTDSDSDVEIVSITPSNKENSNTSRRTHTGQPTSFLESITIDVDTTRRRYGFRTFGNFNNTPTHTTTEIAHSSTSYIEQPPQTVFDRQDVLEVINDTPIETLNIDNDIVETTESNTNVPVKENNSVVNIMQADTSGNEMSKSDKVTSSDLEVPVLSPTNLSCDLSEVPMELEISDYLSDFNEKIVDTAAPKAVEVSSSSNTLPENSISAPSQSSAVQEVANFSKAAQMPISVKTNGTINHICRCSQLLGTLAPTEREERSLEVFPAISSTTSENIKVVTDNQDSSKNKEIEGTVASENLGENTVYSERNSKNSEIEALITPAGSENVAVETEIESLRDKKIETTIVEENLKNRDAEPIVTVEASSIISGTEVVLTSGEILMECPTTDKVDDGQHTMGNIEVDRTITSGDKSKEISKSDEVEATIATDVVEENVVNEVVPEENLNQANGLKEVEMSNEEVCYFEEVEYSEKDIEQIVPLVPEVQEICEQVEAPTIHLDTLSIKTVVDQPKKSVNGALLNKDPEQCKSKDERTLQCDAKVTKCRTEIRIEECQETTSARVDTPLDTGQDSLFVPPLDTGQFDVNSPASPDNAPKSRDTKMLRVVGGLRKGQQHGEFGYPTPPGSEEEKDTDEQTKLIYSHILQTQEQEEDFLSEMVVDDTEIDPADLLERLSDVERELSRSATPGIGKSYEQIVKDSVGSQNSSDEDDDEIVSKKCNSKDQDQDISFDEMEQFLKKCENDDYPQANRKKRKRQKAVAEDSRSRKNSFTRSPKRVKINDEPETHFITYDEDSKDDVWSDQNAYNPSSSSDDEDDVGRRSLAKRKPSPMPLSKYLSKKNGIKTHLPLSGRLSPEKPPPLKGILKRIEQRHTYQPLHPVDDEPETAMIVLHEREIGRGKRGSIAVKVFKISFAAFQVPFDDYKLCHHAMVYLKHVKHEDMKDNVSVRTNRDFEEEEMYNQPDNKPMYKIVFDKKSPQLNSNDRKYYCDPSISSVAAAKQQPNKRTLYESENEQGTVHLSTEISNPTPPVDPSIPISPPYFSPSSNSSSEFPESAKLIPFQDIERALLVVEPDKSECRERNVQNAYKSIDMETIELLSNNADFHKMLRDLNGDVLIEKVPLISVEETADGVVTAFVNDNDLVSNLNTDEQLLKNVCRQLESEAMASQNRLIVDGAFLEVLDATRQDVETYSATMPGDSFPLRVVSNTVPASLHRHSYSADPPLAHSGYTEAGYPSTFVPKHSPPLVPPLAHMYPSDLSVYPMHQQPYPNLHAGYPEAGCFSTARTSPLTVTSASIISMGQETYNVPDSSLIHSGYSEMNASIASPQLKMPVYSVSPQTLPVNMKSFIPNPSVVPSLYPEGLLPYPQTTSSSYTCSVPAYPDANCLIPNLPRPEHYPEKKPIVPSPPLTAPPHSTVSNAQHLDTSASIPSLPSTSKCSKTLRCSSRRESYRTKQPQVKTDKRRKRLPKEVLTISQINESTTDLSNLDNNNKTNSSIYPTTNPGIFTRTRSRLRSSRCLRVSQPTDYFCKTSKSRDPRLRQPILCVSPPFVARSRKPSLRIHFCCPAGKKRWVRRKSLRKIGKRYGEVEFPIVNAVLGTTTSKPKQSSLERCCCSTTKVEPTPMFIESTQKFIEPTQKFVEPTQKFIEPTQSFVEPMQKIVESTQKFIEPTQSFVEPMQKFVESTQKFIEPTQKFIEPTRTFVEPTQTFVESTQKFIEPIQQFVESTQKFIEPTQTFVESTQKFIEPTQKFVEPTQQFVETNQKFIEPTTKFVEPKIRNFVEPSRKFVESTPKIIEPKFVEPTRSRLVEPKPKIVEPIPDVHFAVPKSAPRQNAHLKTVPPPTSNNEQKVQKAPARKRGRPPKNSKSHSKDASAKDHIPSTSKHIPVVAPRGVKASKGAEQKNYPATRSASQPRIEPLKIIKDPKSKNYCKVVPVRAKTPEPMPVPGTYNFNISDTETKEVCRPKAKQAENAENQVEFETHLPLKKRKLSMPVTSPTPTQSTSLARSREKEISYPATPMLSIADVYMQSRVFKTPAEKKQLPPESSKTVPSQFNSSPYPPNPRHFPLNLDCPSYSPPTVLFPPKFSHTN